jgi:hypothetical protein
MKKMGMEMAMEMGLYIVDFLLDTVLEVSPYNGLEEVGPECSEQRGSGAYIIDTSGIVRVAVRHVVRCRMIPNTIDSMFVRQGMDLCSFQWLEVGGLVRPEVACPTCHSPE